MNQADERRLNAKIEEEQANVTQLLLQLDEHLDAIGRIRAEMKLGIERLKTLGSLSA